MTLADTSEKPEIIDDTPLFFLPGFMGSRLWRLRRGLLARTVLVWPLSIYPLITQAILLEEESHLQPDGLVGNYYDGLIDFITGPKEKGGLGHQLDEDFWIFPYDWRLSCQISGEEFSKFIEEKLAKANAHRHTQGLPPWQSADVINHSMGGFVTRAAMIEHSAPIRRVVYLASGHYGTAKAFFALHPDTMISLIDDFVKDLIPLSYWEILKSTPNVLFLQGWLARIIQTFQSVYELLPDRYYLDEQHSLIIDTTRAIPHPVIGLEDTYYRHPWKLPLKQQKRVKEAMQFKERLGRDLPGNENLVIYSNSLPTYSYVNYKRRLQYPEKQTTGDLTIVEASANHDERATRLCVTGEHTEIPNLAATHEAIRDFLPAL